MIHRPHQSHSRVTDVVFRYCLCLLLLIISYYYVTHLSSFEMHLTLVSLPREMMLSIIGAQLVGAVLLLKGFRVCLTAALLAINSVISATYLSLEVSWVLVAGFMVLALRSYGKSDSQWHCGPPFMK